MKILVKRKHLKADYTIGEMHIDYDDGKGWQFFCHTLEDKVRDLNKDGDQKTKVRKRFTVKRLFHTGSIR